MKRILIPVDGSENSKKAIEKAKSLAELYDSELTLIYVINDTMINNPYVIRNDYRTELGTILSQQGEKILKEASELLGPQIKKIKTVMKYGDPGNTIIDYAEKNDFNLLVMGSRGLNAISRIMLGSVSLKVLNHINISVLIVKC